jgi:hypothetical protein
MAAVQILYMAGIFYNPIFFMRLLPDILRPTNVGTLMLKTEEYLIETADRCIRLARAGREIADSLEALSNDLMAKAVALDTTEQKKNRKTCR